MLQGFKTITTVSNRSVKRVSRLRVGNVVVRKLYFTSELHPSQFISFKWSFNYVVYHRQRHNVCLIPFCS